MTDYNYPTAYVSGMTQIPIRTIQEYVSTFRKHFSQDAGKPQKGRRFLPADVDKLFAIKRLRNERIPDDEIKKYLSGEIELPFKLAHQFSTKEVMDMAAHSLEFFDRAQKILEEADEKIHDAKLMEKNAQDVLKQARNEIQAMRNQLSQANNTLGKFRDWQLFMMRLDPAFNPYTQDDPNEPMPEIRQEKKGLFEKILGG
jgi:DNA-binding transcriptional MerR regulator